MIHMKISNETMVYSEYKKEKKLLQQQYTYVLKQNPRNSFFVEFLSFYGSFFLVFEFEWITLYLISLLE